MPTNRENILDRWRRMNMFSSADVLKLANDACLYIATVDQPQTIPDAEIERPVAETTITDHMLEVLRRLVQQKKLMSEIRFRVIRDPRCQDDQSTIDVRIFIDGKERGGYGASVSDPAIPEGVQDELKKFMHMLVHNLGKLGVD